METQWHQIQTEIRYLTETEGGRKSGVFSGYRGQFHYIDDHSDWDGFQYFPDHAQQIVPLGETVRAMIRFAYDRWEVTHKNRIHEGMDFEIREGARLVGNGRVTDVSPPQIDIAAVS